MGKHSYDAFTEVSDIMRCTRIYPFGIGAAVEITIARGVHSDNNVFATGMVPSRPTGAHRHDEVPVDIATYIYATFVECVRDPTPGMMEFEFIDIPRV